MLESGTGIGHLNSVLGGMGDVWMKEMVRFHQDAGVFRKSTYGGWDLLDMRSSIVDAWIAVIEIACFFPRYSCSVLFATSGDFSYLW